MSKLILQNIADDVSFDSLPAVWQDFDLKKFSKEKTLYDFQENALENVLKILWKYYGDEIDYREKENLETNKERKKYLFRIYENNGLDKDYSYDLTKREGKKAAKLIEEYYPLKDSKVSFENFINRIAFWMATGSGKTLVIVKLLEILKKLVEGKKIPANDILFLTHREDLIDQFKEYIKEFNSSQNDIFINLKSLKDYDAVKRDTQSLFKDKEIVVFYYRSDLISDEQKEKIVDFRNYDNDGRWYILLDEAHKGDKEESKRQILYSILSRNGFLFNFSATFTDPRDFITTGFNFNLANFIQAGYGKHIYLSQEEILAFRERDDFSAIEKQKIVLKSLILLSYVRKFADRTKKIKKGLYHYPLLLTLVNSVNVEEADLKLFFKELEKIGQGKLKKKLFEETKKEIVNSFEGNQEKYMFEDEDFILDENLLEKITYKDILKDVFNSKSFGNIEVLTIPRNRNELIFKLRTSEKPFALIKIGDISGWLKDQLEGYEINESFDNESVFRRINRDDSDINILMGSRSFYEGWDSNRPNLLLFINIGVGADAKKFVLQSVGRGVRIEPEKNKRKRLKSLYNAKAINESIFNRVKNYVLPLETLFVFGTNATALRETIKTLEEEKGDEHLLAGEIIKNKRAEELPLYIPVYKLASYTFAEKKEAQKFSISQDDYTLTKDYFEYLGDDRVVLMKHESDPKTLEAVRDSFNEPEQFYRYEKQTALLNPSLTFSQLIQHLSLVPEEFDKFKKLEEEIVHFEKIKFNWKGKWDEFLESLRKVRDYEEKEEKVEQLQLDFEKHKIDARKFTKSIQGLEKNYPQSLPFDGIKIEYIPNHYYFPLILSERKEKIDYLNHIITEESEVKFLEKLEEYLNKEDNQFNRFDWWLFSKLDEHTDEVYLPYYHRDHHKVERFKPDFIFWLKKGRSYSIVFIDPKSYKYTDYEDKVDGYRTIFEGKENSIKSFQYSGYNINVHLFLNVDDINLISEKYRSYWFDNINQVLERVK
jgi:superfamily II DNA or RNA helicase